MCHDFTTKYLSFMEFKLNLVLVKWIYLREDQWSDRSVSRSQDLSNVLYDIFISAEDKTYLYPVFMSLTVGTHSAASIAINSSSLGGVVISSVISLCGDVSGKHVFYNWHLWLDGCDIFLCVVLLLSDPTYTMKFKPIINVDSTYYDKLL